MSRTFLLEIGMEEMPAKFAPGVIAQLDNNARKKLNELRISFEEIKVYVTPRRLALYISGLADKQEDVCEEVKGPAQKAAYDNEGNPTKAVQGFARGQGVNIEDLFIRELNGVPYVYASKSLKGEEIKNILPQFCLDMITGLNFPKPMRWGDYEIRFARPIRWLVALCDDEVIPFSYAGLHAGRISRGHRTLGSSVSISKAENYLEDLENVFVIADQIKRKNLIWEQVLILAAGVGGFVDADDDLLNEISNLLEYPTALIGEVDLKYMIMPEEVITTPMKEHQRYFPVRSEEGKLLPYFITVRNGDRKALDKVKEGNKKVLKARLEDAAFYYREDLKEPLEANVSKLEKVIYHDKLGTVAQRVARLGGLSEIIAEKMELGNEEKLLAKRTAFLAKADLVTHMVYDFPELQGIMGAYYAASNGEDKEVVRGIKEHYWPRFAGDKLPGSYSGRVVSIADKLDAIVGAFCCGIQPTGSQDPYALRRQALGVVSMLKEDKHNISLTGLIEESYKIFEGQGLELEPLAKILPLMEDFFAQRLRFILQEEGLRYDTVDAVMAQGGGFPFSIEKKARILSVIREEEDFNRYVNAYTRCVNLSKKADNSEWSFNDLLDRSELDVLGELIETAPLVAQAVQESDYEQAFRKAARIVPYIEKLFDSVMIMAEEENIRRARLGLLSKCVEVLSCLGDLTLLV